MMKTTTNMELVELDKLVPYVNNARTHSPEQINKLRASLREFGFINPVIIDKDYGIIAGHGRVIAAREEGIEKTIRWYLDNQEWLDNITSGAYERYYEEMYGNR